MELKNSVKLGKEKVPSGTASYWWTQYSTIGFNHWGRVFQEKKTDSTWWKWKWWKWKWWKWKRWN